MTRRYYEEEMRYLHEAGKLFAEKHPEQARYLNIDSVSDRDPYVERLFEGFAFLTGRIHERLDDELPQYTESLCKALFPHFLKPIPSLSIVEFSLKPGAVQGTSVLKRGIEVSSEVVGDERVVCRFRTTQDVKLHPLQLQGVELHWLSDGTTKATLQFQVDRGVDYQKLDLNPLRLHFHAEPTVVSLMHLFFTQYVSKLVISGSLGAVGVNVPSIGDEFFKTSSVTLEGQRWIQPGGLAKDEGLLPYSKHSFSGFRLLQEYLCFRRKFWCIDLYGLDRYTPDISSNTFQVEVFFDRSYPEEKRFVTENVRLFCSPIVNLFRRDSIPIQVDHTKLEYKVVASTRYRQSMEVYSVDKVIGLEEKTGNRFLYQPFSPIHLGATGDQKYYTASSRFGPTDLYETYLTLDGVDVDKEQLAKETLSIEVVCTNGSLPREKLREGMINGLASDAPQVVNPHNLTQPTLAYYPPTHRQKDYFWKLIAHWSLNFLSVANHEALIGLLKLYDWPDTDANRRRIAGISNVTWKPKEVMYRGSILRGAEIILAVKEDHYTNDGDVNLLGLILHEFFSLYATINSFVHLTIDLVPSGKHFEWKPRTGKQPLV